jgi:diguanylate cyclase (GGDEF)-like protein/PAS domain S-box-containing protein
MLFFILSFIPVLGNVLAWTNHKHHLIRENIFLNDSGLISFIGKDYGMGFWFLAAYNYSLCLFMFYVLFNSLKDKSLIYRKQVNFFAASILLPILTNIYNLSGMNPLGFDLTPLAFGISGVILYFGIIKYEIFDMVPIARSYIVDEIKSGVIVTDRTGKIVDTNKAARAIFNVKENEILGKYGKEFFSSYPEIIKHCGSKEEKILNFEIDYHDESKIFEISITPLINSGKEYLGCILLLRDISEKIKSEEILAFAASHDYLTGLPNRYFFMELFEKEISQSKRRKDSFAIVYVDLDGFKKVNDLYGHDIGDLFLRHVSQCFTEVIREGDIVARFGGDEFVILLTDVKDKLDIEKVIGRIFTSFSEGYDMNGTIVPIKASIGVSIYPDDGDDSETLLKKADLAMYDIKNTPERNSWRFYE